MSRQHLLADMFATNRAANGAGRRPPQVGVGFSAFISDCLDGDLQRQIGVICNPTVRLLRSGATVTTWTKGCLSLPGGHAELARPAAGEGPVRREHRGDRYRPTSTVPPARD